MLRFNGQALLAVSALFGALTLGYVATAGASSGSFIPNANCVECQVAMRQAELSPLSSSVTAVLNHPSLLSYPSLTSTVTPNWDGVGPLPGAFERPWEFAATNFDPSFRTPYWSETSGPMNNPAAPWNQGFSSGFGNSIFGYGMLYLGSPYLAPLAPVMRPSAQVAPAV